MGAQKENIGFGRLNRVAYENGKLVDLYNTFQLERSATREEIRLALANYSNSGPKDFKISPRVRRSLDVYELLTKFRAEYDQLLNQQIQPIRVRVGIAMEEKTPTVSERASNTGVVRPRA